MNIGFYYEGKKETWVTSESTDPFLIVGREARETLVRLFLDEVYGGKGCAYFGDAEEVLTHIPSSRTKDTVLFEMDSENPPAFNPFKGVPPSGRSDVAEHVLEAFTAVWDYKTPTPQFDMYMLTASLAMMGIKDGSLLSLPYLLTSKTYRTYVIRHLKDAILKRHWEHFDELPLRDQNDRTISVLNRLIPLITDPLMRNVIGQLRTMDIKDTDILIVRLPKGKKYELLAGLIQSRLNGRVFVEKPLIFVGGGQPVIACRYLDELSERLKNRLLGTANIISFKAGARDEKILKPYFNIRDNDIQLTSPDMVPNLAYVRLEDIYLLEMPPHFYPKYPHSPKAIKDRSRTNYTERKAYVEEHIERFVENT